MKRTLALTTFAAALAVSGAAMAQNASLSPVSGSERLSAGFTPDPYRLSVIAGGGTDASRLGGNCTGNISEAPDFRLTYDAGSWPLIFRTEASEDTTLVINGPDGSWSCDDDSGGSLGALVRFDRPRSGVYDVWIGTYGGGIANGTLTVSERGDDNANRGDQYGPERPRGAYDDGRGGQRDDRWDRPQRPDHGGGHSGGYGGPDPSARANFGEISLDMGFTPDPYRVDVVAGGTYDATQMGQSGCVGRISEAPDFQLTYEGGWLPLAFRTRSLTDTTLVINGPDGRWYCDDDSGGGINAQVRFDNPRQGVYDVWVGTYGDQPAQTTLSITETP